MVDILKDLQQAEDTYNADQLNIKRASAEEVLRDRKAKTGLSNYGYTEDQYDYVQFIADGGRLEDDPAGGGVQLPNKYIKPAQEFVVGRDLVTGQRIVSPYKDKGKFIDRGVANLQKSNRATSATPPPQDSQMLSKIAFGVLNDGVSDYNAFSALAPTWPEQQKRQAWQAALQALYRVDIERKLVANELPGMRSTEALPEEPMKVVGPSVSNDPLDKVGPATSPKPVEKQQPQYPKFEKKVTYDELMDNPQWPELSKQFYKELSGKEWEGTDESAAQFGMWWLSAFNWNVSYQASMATKAKFTKNEKLKQLMHTMLVIDDNLEMSWPQTGRNVWAMGADPVNYMTLGAGRLAAQAMKAEIRNNIGKTVTRSQMLKTNARIGANVGAPIGAGFATLDDFMRQTVAVEAGAQDEYSQKSLMGSAAIGTVAGAGFGAAIGAAPVALDASVEFGKELYNTALTNAMKGNRYPMGSPGAMRGSVGVPPENLPALIPSESDFEPRQVPYVKSKLSSFVDSPDSGLPKKALPKQYIDKLISVAESNKAPFKPEELRWSPVLDWLESQPQDQPVSLPDLRTYMKDQGVMTLEADFRGGMLKESRQALSVYGKKEPALEGEYIPAGESGSKEVTAPRPEPEEIDTSSQYQYTVEELEEKYSEASQEAFDRVLTDATWSESRGEIDDGYVSQEMDYYFDDGFDSIPDNLKTDVAESHADSLVESLNDDHGWDFVDRDDLFNRVITDQVDFEKLHSDLASLSNTYLDFTNLNTALAERRRRKVNNSRWVELQKEVIGQPNAEGRYLQGDTNAYDQADLVGYSEDDMQGLIGRAADKEAIHDLFDDMDAFTNNAVNKDLYRDDQAIYNWVDDRARESAEYMAGTVYEDDILGYQIHEPNENYGGEITVRKPNGRWMSENFRDVEEAKQAIYMDMQDNGFDPTDHGYDPLDYMDSDAADEYRAQIAPTRGMDQRERNAFMSQQTAIKKKTELPPKHTSMSIGNYGHENVLLKANAAQLDKVIPGFKSKATSSFHHEDAENAMGTARTALLSPEESGVGHEVRFINEVQGDWPQYADKHISDVRADLDERFDVEGVGAIITANPETLTLQPNTVYARRERAALHKKHLENMAKAKKALEDFDADGGEKYYADLMDKWSKARKESEALDITKENQDKAKKLAALMERLGEEHSKKPEQVRKKLQAMVDAYDLGAVGFDKNATSELEVRLSKAEDKRFMDALNAIGLDNMNEWAEATNRTPINKDTAMHHIAYMVDKWLTDNYSPAASAILKPEDDIAERERFLRQMINSIRNDKFRDTDHAAAPFGGKLHEPVMNTVIADSIRRGEKGLMWPADPWLVAQVENWSVPLPWMPDESGKYMDQSGQDRTPQVRRMLRDMPEFVEKSLAKDFGVELKVVKIKPKRMERAMTAKYAKGFDAYYIEYTPRLIDEARRNGLNLTRALAPIGITPALMQMRELHKDEDETK